MTRVIAVATSKGGTGKTTIAASLVDCWRQMGQTVAVLDTDPNQSISRWLGRGDYYQGVTLTSTADEHDIVSAVTGLAETADKVVIDTAGFGNQAMIYAVGVSSLVLIPVLADEASLFEAMKMRRLIESASTLTRREIPFITVLNRARQTLVAKHTLKQLRTLGLNPSNVTIGDRALFQEASYHGASPFSLDPKSKAWLEVRRLAKSLDESVALAA